MEKKRLLRILYRCFFTLFCTKRIAQKFIDNYDKKKVNIELLYDKKRNIGDTLNPLIFNYISKRYNITIIGKHKNTNLAMVGSIIGYCPFNCYIWGAGILSKEHSLIIKKTSYIKRAAFAVRGPLTRDVLTDSGYKVPEIYGDPAILLPLIYKPKNIIKKHKISFIPHYADKTTPFNNIHIINVLTEDYKFFINEIMESEMIISSSLHGIIIAESFGIPTIWLKTQILDDFKFYDWYLSTRKKEDISCSDSLEKALKLTPKPLPLSIIKKMQNNLIEAFPKHLFRKAKN